MSSIQDIRTPLDPEQFYHIYNRGNGGQLIFYDEKNYYYFLEKLKKYMLHYWDMYAFCLMPNHFHFLVKIKSNEKIIEAAKNDFKRVSKNFLDKFTLTELAYKNPELLKFQNFANLNKEDFKQLFNNGRIEIFQTKLLQWIVSERFRRFLLAYAKAINNQENKSGSLFQKLFRRKRIESFNYLFNTVLYIHRNPVHHNRALAFNDWHWTSYFIFLSENQTVIKRQEVLDWFGSLENFRIRHQQEIDDWINGERYIIDD